MREDELRRQKEELQTKLKAMTMQLGEVISGEKECQLRIKEK